MIRRWGFNIASGVSLLTLLAACIFWARPNWWRSAVYTTADTGNARRTYGIAAHASRLQMWQIVGTSGWNPGLQWERYPFDSGKYWIWFNLSHDRWRFGGVAHYADKQDSVFIVHLAWIAALGAVLPTLWCIRKYRALSARSPGACRRCSYDLTGNISGVCPECGTPCAVAVK